MTEFLTVKPDAFGLDITACSINIAKLDKKKSGYCLRSFNSIEIGSQPLRDGELKNEEFLTDLLKKALLGIKGRALKTKHVIASLPEDKAFLQVIQMPKIGERELAKAIMFEAENYIPMKSSDVYLDFQIVKPIVDSLDHHDVLIVAFPKKIVDSYFKILKKVGLKPVAFETESQSVARAVIRDGLLPSRAFIIDIGAKRTNFIVFAGHDVRFTSSIPIGAQTFNDLIIKELNVSLKQAIKLQTEAGLAQKVIIKIGEAPNNIEVGPGKIFEVLIPAATDLIEQIQRLLNFYISRAKHEHLPVGAESSAKIFLCGEGAYLKDIDKFFSEVLGQDVIIANPWINIGNTKGGLKIPSSQTLKYTTALGLALRGAGYD